MTLNVSSLWDFLKFVPGIHDSFMISIEWDTNTMGSTCLSPKSNPVSNMNKIWPAGKKSHVFFQYKQKALQFEVFVQSVYPLRMLGIDYFQLTSTLIYFHTHHLLVLVKKLSFGRPTDKMDRATINGLQINLGDVVLQFYKVWYFAILMMLWNLRYVYLFI